MNDLAKKILIAEDEKALADALKLKLRKEGYIVEVAPDGEYALSELEKKKYDLMLLDLLMPRKDGFEVMKALQNKKVQLPIIVITNLSSEEYGSQARGLGAKEFFVKFDTPMSTIIEKVSFYLSQPA